MKPQNVLVLIQLSHHWEPGQAKMFISIYSWAIVLSILFQEQWSFPFYMFSFLLPFLSIIFVSCYYPHCNIDNSWWKLRTLNVNSFLQKTNQLNIIDLKSGRKPYGITLDLVHEIVQPNPYASVFYTDLFTANIYVNRVTSCRVDANHLLITLMLITIQKETWICCTIFLAVVM